jgi:hypothetical protein
MKTILIATLIIVLITSCTSSPKVITASVDSTLIPSDTLRRPPIGKPKFPDVAIGSEQDSVVRK